MCFEMAEWRETETLKAGVGQIVKALVSQPVWGMSKQEYMASLPRQRSFAMLWEIEKNGRRSWIGGTAHFFCYSFEASFRRLFEKVDTVIFEGPLDPVSLEEVSRVGRTPEPESPRIADAMKEEEIQRLERVVCGPRGRWARWLGLESPDPTDVRYFLSQTRHWMAFFSIWTAYLHRQGWHQSVDLEAWQLAREMGKSVRAMETIKEQIQTLENVPVERIVNYFRNCRQWNRYIHKNVKAYLKGDLDGMMGTSTEFPSRTERVIQRRDVTFLERMAPFLEAGRCTVFVGSAHMLNLRQMLSNAGFSVRRAK